MTTRSTKRIVSASTNPINSNPTTPTKRKRPQCDNPAPAPTSWLGIALQLPSVIKKEINDFVKTVRGGGNTLQSAARLNTSSNTRYHQRIECGSTKRYLHRRRQGQVQVDDHPRSHFFHSTPHHDDSLPRIPTPEFFRLDLPSPPKKFKRSVETSMSHESINTNSEHPSSTHHQDLLEPSPLIQSTGTLPSAQVEPDCTDSLSATTDFPARLNQSHEAQDNDAEMEEIICNLPKKVEKHAMCPSNYLTGSNSVRFPDSRNLHPFDSPGSSVNADVSSSTWLASSCHSINSGSNIHRGFSNHTSLTSSTSVEMNQYEDLRTKGHHDVRLDSINSQPSPRIRHTKILGTPRNHHTLSGSSLSSIGSVLTSDVLSRQSSRFQLHGASERTLGKGINYSLTNLDAPSDNDREFLTSDSDINHESPAAIQIGRRISSHRPTLACRRKVPLAEIIGRPLNQAPSISSLQSYPDYGRESYRLNPSLSIASITSSFAGCPNVTHTPPSIQIQPQSMKESENTSHQSDSNNVQNTDVANPDTSATLSNLRTQLSHNMRIEASSPAEPVLSLEPALNLMSKSLPAPPCETPHHGMIMEVDEEAEDNSYEFLDRAEAQSLSPEAPHRKRKRILHRSDLMNFRRQGAAAIQKSPNKLVELSPNVPLAKPKSNAGKKFRLSRSHKRHQSCSEENARNSKVSGNEDAPSPNKKIRILESEIARLRRELESEKTKSAQRSSFYRSCNQSDAHPNDLAENAHVAFSSNSPFSMSSPASPRRFSSRPGTYHSEQESEITPESPVVVRKPPEGAMVGGSPFIVSRVYGNGPEVAGEATPVHADKWLHKRKMPSSNQASGRLPAIVNDLFGVKSLKSSLRTSGADSSRTANNSSGWKRDHQLEADLISSPKPRTLKKIHRNSRGPSVVPPSHLRNMFGNSINDSQRNSGSSIMKKPPTNCQPPEMTTFLNELKACGKTKLRKTPASAKLYISQPFSPESSRASSNQKNARNSRSINSHHASILNSVMHNFGVSDSSASRVSTLSGRTEASASSTNTHDGDRVPNGYWSSSVSNTADCSKSLNCSEKATRSSDQVKSPLSRKVYPSGVGVDKSQKENHSGQVQVVLGEAISTPRKSKQTAHLSRSLVDPHMTPRIRGCNSALESHHSTLEKDFSMDELIKQVKDLKDSEAMVDGEAGGSILATNNLRQNHQLVHAMGFCSSVENSMEISSNLISSTGSGPSSSSSLMPATTTSRVSQDMNRQRTSPLLKNLTEGRPKPSTSPSKNQHLAPKTIDNRWSSSSTIRLVSILNNSSDGRSGLDKSGATHPPAHARSKPHERRVRILEDMTNLNTSFSGSAHAAHRHSLPIDLIARNSVGASQVESRGVVAVGSSAKQLNESHGEADKPESDSGPGWVLVKPGSKTTSQGEPNLRRWSLRASAILSTHPKIV